MKAKERRIFFIFKILFVSYFFSRNLLLEETVRQFFQASYLLDLTRVCTLRERVNVCVSVCLCVCKRESESVCVR